MSAGSKFIKPLKSAVVPKAVVSRVRDRIFETACDLFYRKGIRDVCVDAIASEAGSNKMSFYRNFTSKDELVAEFLLGQEKDHWAWWDAAIKPHAGDGRRQLEALFDAYAEKSRSLSVAGCALCNASVELRDENHPGYAVVRGFKTEMRKRLRRLARAAGAHNSEQLGDALQLLIEGGYLSRISFTGNDGPFAVTATVAKMLVEAHLR